MSHFSDLCKHIQNNEYIKAHEAVVQTPLLAEDDQVKMVLKLKELDLLHYIGTMIESLNSTISGL